MNLIELSMWLAIGFCAFVCVLMCFLCYCVLFWCSAGFVTFFFCMICQRRRRSIIPQPVVNPKSEQEPPDDLDVSDLSDLDTTSQSSLNQELDQEQQCHDSARFIQEQLQLGDMCTIEEIFGFSLEKLVKRDKSHNLKGSCPRIVLVLVKILLEKCFREELSYRLLEYPSISTKMADLKLQLVNKSSYDFSGFEINTVFEVLKDFFVSLEPPVLILTKKHAKRFYSISGKSESDKVGVLKSYVASLPRCHQETLSILFQTCSLMNCHRVENFDKHVVNMTGENFKTQLSTLLSDMLCGKFCSVTRRKEISDLVLVMMENVTEIFSEDTEEWKAFHEMCVNWKEEKAGENEEEGEKSKLELSDSEEEENG